MDIILSRKYLSSFDRDWAEGLLVELFPDVNLYCHLSSAPPGAFVVVGNDVVTSILKEIRRMGHYPMREYISPVTHTRKFEVYGPLGIV